MLQYKKINEVLLYVGNVKLFSHNFFLIQESHNSKAACQVNPIVTWHSHVSY